MAERPVFMISEYRPFVAVRSAEFRFFSGFSLAQKQRSIESLHAAFLEKHPGERLLEISGSSPEALGTALSAFNLTITTRSGRSFSVEAAFQSSKVFENGGPYKDLLSRTAREAKKDPRLRESGPLTAFRFGEREFPLEPKTAFYNWLYINALLLHPELAGPLADYTAFTDIAFNPERSVNCQACAAAVYVSLKRAGLIDEAMKSFESFVSVVYPAPEGGEPSQLSLWEL